MDLVPPEIKCTDRTTIAKVNGARMAKSFAVVPSAGLSRRMGQPKLLLPWNERQTVIEATLQAWRQSRVEKIVAVVRADDQRLAELCQRQNVQVVQPQPPPPQMKDSVWAALQWIAVEHQPTAMSVWLLAPADMPGLKAQLIDLLLENHDPRAPAILKPCFRGKPGHPVLFPWPLAAEVQSLPENAGIDQLTKKHPVRLIHCDDSSVLDDMDTPADYDELRRRHHRP